MEFKFFKPLPDMIGEACAVCSEPIGGDDVLVQEFSPGGGNCLMHQACLDKIMAEDEDDGNLH